MRAKLEFLAEFLAARRVESFPDSVWRAVLGTSATEVANELIRNGLIIEASTRERIESERTVAELRAHLKARELKVSGRKAELVERLLRCDPHGAISILADKLAYVCSDQGRMLAASNDRTQRRRARSYCILECG